MLTVLEEDLLSTIVQFISSTSFQLQTEALSQELYLKASQFLTQNLKQNFKEIF